MRTFNSDRSKATIIEARENAYGHAGRITTCFLTLRHRREKPLLFFPSNEPSLMKMPLKLQKQSHWHSGSLQISKVALTFTEIHQNHVFAREALCVGFPTHVALQRQRGHTPSSCPEPICSCVQHSITPLLPHYWQEQYSDSFVYLHL